MWADSIITVFTMITITAKNLIPRRISVVLEPFIKFGSVMKEAVSFSKFSSVIIDVIKIQEKALGFSAAGTTIAAVGINGLVLQTVVISKAMFSMLISVVNVPLCSPFGIAFRMFMAIVFKPFLRPLAPLSSILKDTFFTALTMPFVLIFGFVAFVTRLYHGIVSVIKPSQGESATIREKSRRAKWLEAPRSRNG
jgi:hypothetical protein